MLLFLLLPAAPLDIPYDGIDQNGDGVDLIDVDGDGFPGALAFGPDCADRDAAMHPGAPDRTGDLVDADCGGSDGRDRRAPRRRSDSCWGSSAGPGCSWNGAM